MKNDLLQKISDLIKSSWTKIFDQKQIRLELEGELNDAITNIDFQTREHEYKIQTLTVSYVEFFEDKMSACFEFKTQNSQGSADIHFDLKNNTHCINKLINKKTN
jgi:hypothetical protein